MEADNSTLVYDPSGRSRFAGLIVTVIDDDNPRVVTECGQAFPLDLENQLRP